MFESKGKMKRKVKSFIILLVSMSLSFVACLLILGFGENKNTNVDKHNPTQILYIPVSVNQVKGERFVCRNGQSGRDFVLFNVDGR